MKNKILSALFIGVLFSTLANAQICSSTITKLGNATESFLMVKFDPSNAPYSVQVKGTSDKELVRGSSGVWLSKQKYTSTIVTLIMFNVAGVQISECKYDANGNLVIQECFAEFALVDVGVTGTVSWAMTAESDIKEYIVQSSDNGLNFTDVCTAPFNNLGFYTCQDNSKKRFYAITPVCNSGKKLQPNVIEIR